MKHHRLCNKKRSRSKAHVCNTEPVNKLLGFFLPMEIKCSVKNCNRWALFEFANNIYSCVKEEHSLEVQMMKKSYM